MKSFSLTVIITMMCASFMLSCKKGPVGPEGPEGPAGPAGPVGAANVTQINIAPFPHTGAEVSKTFNLSKVDFEKVFYMYM